MDTRSPMLSTTFFFLGIIVSQGKAQETGCSETISQQHTYPDRKSVDVFCGDGQWRIGHDLDVCNQSIFKDYDRCGGLNAICTIPLADYNNSGPTVFSCWDHHEQSQVYIQIMIRPNASHQVPAVARAGHREVAYTFFTVKPYPVETPTANVTLFPLVKDGSNRTPVMLDVTTEVTPHPRDLFKYIAVHSFDIPSDVDNENTVVKIEFIEPKSWAIVDQRIYLDTAIIKVPDVNLPSSTTLSSTEGEESTSATVTCHGSDTLAVAVVSASVPSVIITIVVSFICCIYLLKKKRNKKNSKTNEDIQSPPVPNNLPLHPVTPSSTAGGTSTNSTVTTPAGLTPVSVSESTRLLSYGLGQSRVVRGTSSDSVGAAASPCFQRQLSKDSNSTMTTLPIDGEGGLSSQAATPVTVCSSTGATPGIRSTVHVSMDCEQSPMLKNVKNGQNPIESGGLVIVSGGPATVSSSDASGMDNDTAMTAYAVSSSVSSSASGSCGIRSVKGRTDPKAHVYSTIGDVKVRVPGGGSASCPSLSAKGPHAVEPDGQQKSAQLNQQTGQYHEIIYSHSGVPSHSLTSSSPPSSTNGGTSLISPPLPPYDPNYASGGRNMCLPHQHYNEAYTTNV